MKKVKFDTRLREKPAFNRWIETGDYFTESIDKEISFLSSAVTQYHQILIRFVENKFHPYNYFCRNAFKISANYGKNKSGTN